MIKDKLTGKYHVKIYVFLLNRLKYTKILLISNHWFNY